MKDFLFETTVSTNHKDVWVERNMISPITFYNCESLVDAVNKYAKEVNDTYYVQISKRTLSQKKGIYVDTTEGKTIQVGYIFTAPIHVDYSSGVKRRYLSLWVTVFEVLNPFVSR